MSNLNLSLAMGDYDRTRPIYDGRVKIDGRIVMTDTQMGIRSGLRSCRRRTHTCRRSAGGLR